MPQAQSTRLDIYISEDGFCYCHLHRHLATLRETEPKLAALSHIADRRIAEAIKRPIVCCECNTLRRSLENYR